MWLLMLEAGLALGLFVFILWWTIGPVKQREDVAEREAESAAAASTSATSVTTVTPRGPAGDPPA